VRHELVWSEVAAVFQIPIFGFRPARRRSTNWLLKIELVDGKKIRLRSFEGLRALSYRIQQQLAQRRLITHCQQVYYRGGWIRFGKRLAVGSSGICVGVKPVSWFEINNIMIDEEDGIRIGYTTERSQWLHLPARTVANVHLLSDFLDWIRHTHVRTIDDASPLDDGRAVSVSDYLCEPEGDVEELSRGHLETDDADGFMDDRQSSRPRRPR
jgi:hypothetical protein